MKFSSFVSVAATLFTLVLAQADDGSQYDLSTCEGCTTMCWEASGRSITNPVQLKWRYNSFSNCRGRACYPGRFNPTNVCSAPFPNACELCGVMCETACENEDEDNKQSCYDKCHKYSCVLSGAACPVPENSCADCEAMCHDLCPVGEDGASCYDECHTTNCHSFLSGSGVCCPEGDFTCYT